MGVRAFIEPLVVVALLSGGTWVNRNPHHRLYSSKQRRPYARASPRSLSPASSDGSGRSSPSSSASLLSRFEVEPRWRRRDVQLLGKSIQVVSPNTRQFKEFSLSRLLRNFPFLVEVWYWGLLYWVVTHTPNVSK
jgi:hypothetical protein